MYRNCALGNVLEVSSEFGSFLFGGIRRRRGAVHRGKRRFRSHAPNHAADLTTSTHNRKLPSKSTPD
jgi:hypothetical protein